MVRAQERPSSPYANEGGMAALAGDTDDATLKRELIDAGYRGEKIVLLAGSDVPRISAVCQVMGDLGRRIGMNIDYLSLDWGTVVQRWNSKAAADKNGYHMFGVYFGALDCTNPAAHLLMRGNGAGAFAGWPTSPGYEAASVKFQESTSEPGQNLCHANADRRHERCLLSPARHVFQPAAYRRNLTDMLTGLPLFTNVRRA